MGSDAMTSDGEGAASPQRRLFVLEHGVSHPLDLALAPGTHDLRDLGVQLDFDGERVSATALGHGPTAFALPGMRQLRVGARAVLDDGDRIAWAGRSWRLTSHDLPGDDAAKPRGVCKNAHGAGRPLEAVLLLTRGAERGNFYRVRTEASAVASGVDVRGHLDDDALRVEVRAEPGRAAVVVNGSAAAAGAWHPLAPDQVVEVRSGDAVVLAAVLVCPGLA